MPCMILSVLFWGIFIGIDLFFGKSFWCDIKEFVKNFEKKFKWTFIFLIITLILGCCCNYSGFCRDRKKCQ